jgi:hypothetical protein
LYIYIFENNYKNEWLKKRFFVGGILVDNKYFCTCIIEGIMVKFKMPDIPNFKPTNFKPPSAPKPQSAPKPPSAPKTPDAPKAPDAPDAPKPPKAPDAPDAPDAPKPPKAPDAPDAPKPPPAGGGGMFGGLGMAAAFALPSLAGALPSLIGAGTQLGGAAIIAESLPETITALGDAVGGIISDTGATLTTFLSDNPLLVAGSLGIVGFIAWRKFS